MGLNSSLSSPTSEQVCSKRGGSKVDSDGSTPDNRMMIFDHSLRVIDHEVYLGLKGNVIISEHEFKFLVPSNLPANQAVVIQQLSIG